MKKTIKIKYVDFWGRLVDIPVDTMFHKVLEDHYNIEISDEPDYIICSCFGEDYKNYDCVRIMLIGENFSTDWNEYDYGIDFDDYSFLDRHFHMINNAFINMDYASVDKMREKHLHAEQSFKEKTKFCSYIYSNPIPFRDAFFDRVSQYKPVTAGGKCKRKLEDINGNANSSKDWNTKSMREGVFEKIEIEKSHKFSIAFENSSREGYITEKLVDSFAAGTIPIYYGAPDVTKYFNEKAMVIIKDEQDVENAIERIKEIDQNDELYLQMLKEKAVLDDELFDQYQSEFEKFVCHIFDQPLEKAYRKTEYTRRIIHVVKQPETKKTRLKNKIKKLIKIKES